MSYFGYTPGNNESYAVQYQEAFEFLFNHRNEARNKGKLIDLPLLYLLRHYLELSFKYNIDYFKNYSGSDALISKLNETHDLEKLYQAFVCHHKKSFDKLDLEKDLKCQIKDYIKNLNKFVDIFIQLDKQGYGFRYSHDKNTNQRNFDLDAKVDLIEEIGKPYKNSKVFLDYSIDEHKRILKRKQTSSDGL